MIDSRGCPTLLVPNILIILQNTQYIRTFRSCQKLNMFGTINNNLKLPSPLYWYRFPGDSPFKTKYRCMDQFFPVLWIRDVSQNLILFYFFNAEEKNLAQFSKNY
jgi:hypothetical protein